MTKEDAIRIVYEQIHHCESDEVAWAMATKSLEALIAAGMLPPCNKTGNYDWEQPNVDETNAR